MSNPLTCYTTPASCANDGANNCQGSGNFRCVSSASSCGSSQSTWRGIFVPRSVVLLRHNVRASARTGCLPPEALKATCSPVDSASCRFCPVSLAGSMAYCHYSAVDCQASALNNCSAAWPCVADASACSGAARGFVFTCPSSPPPPRAPPPPLPRLPPPVVSVNGSGVAAGGTASHAPPPRRRAVGRQAGGGSRASLFFLAALAACSYAASVGLASPVAAGTAERW